MLNTNWFASDSVCFETNVMLVPILGGIRVASRKIPFIENFTHRVNKIYNSFRSSRDYAIKNDGSLRLKLFKNKNEMSVTILLPDWWQPKRTECVYTFFCYGKRFLLLILKIPLWKVREVKIKKFKLQYLKIIWQSFGSIPSKAL